ncbi:MAG: biotin--[acetyl-CoA-carboxylase] ligase [Planctomycetota bacterium]
MPTEFELTRLQASLHGWQLSFFEELESTNDWAIQTYRDQPPLRPCLVVAQRQTRGRGRGLKTWQAPPGNLTCSFAFRLAPDAVVSGNSSPLSWPARLAIVSGLSLSQSLNSFLPDVPSAIKWPNDVLIADRKVAGILIETPHPTGAGTEPDARLVVIGIGLNVNSSPAAATLEKQTAHALEPTCLAVECRQAIDLTEVLLTLAGRLEEWLAGTGLLSLPSGARAPAAISDSELLARYQQTLAWRGLQVVLERGESQLTGTLLGVDEAGQLLIQAAGASPAAVAAGELRLARPDRRPVRQSSN